MSSGGSPRRRSRYLGLFAALGVLLACDPGARAEPCQEAAHCERQWSLASGGQVSYFASHALDSSAAITRAVVVVHGNRRDADRYFESVIGAVAAEGATERVAIFAPHFPTQEDDPLPGEHRWSSHGWKIGHKSKDEGRASSFGVVDSMLEAICGQGRKAFPALQRVTIAGHSAGGQFVQRYAAGGSQCSAPEIETRYLVMNPSSYLYIDGRRRVEPGGDFVVPISGCADYDEYKFGLRDLNAYMQRKGAERLRENLFERNVYYLAGGDDTRRSKSLDKRCEADLQGRHRLERFENFRDYSKTFEGWKAARFLVVPDIGHDGRAMFMSEPVRRILFR